MADDLHKLLRYIIEHPLLQSASREAEMDASAVQDVDAEVKAIAEEDRRDADRLAASFAQGLRMASSGQGHITVDDTTPEGNAIADAFARFLVTTHLATSQSSELSDRHFRYTFEVDWPRLHDVARKAGVDLDSALQSRVSG